MDARIFDKRNYPVVPVPQGYGEWSRAYDATIAEGLDRPLLERLRSIDWENVSRAADLACGTGRTAAWVKKKGVRHVDGVDITPEMLALADRRGAHVSLHLADVAATPLPASSYDLCMLVLADEHLAEIGPVYREGWRLLAPRGSFLIVGYHPYFLMNGKLTHFHRATGEAVGIESYVHLFSDHFKTGCRSGLTLMEAEECVIDEQWAKTKPKWRKYLHWPVSYALVWRKSSR